MKFYSLDLRSSAGANIAAELNHMIQESNRQLLDELFAAAPKREGVYLRRPDFEQLCELSGSRIAPFHSRLFGLPVYLSPCVPQGTVLLIKNGGEAESYPLSTLTAAIATPNPKKDSTP